MSYYSGQRYKKIQAIIDKYNAPMVQKGYYWFVTFTH